MHIKHKIDILAGLTLSSTNIAVIKLYGAGKLSFILLSYSFIFLGLFLAAKNMYFDGTLPSVHDLMIIVDHEEKLIKQLVSGKKYRLEGDLEKIGQ